VAFAHGSGSSRFSRRNRYVASVLNVAGLGTLLLDLLTPDEEAIDERTRHLRFDIPMLADRMVGAVDWIAAQPDLRTLPIGLFGASTGAAAALIAAAGRPDAAAAVVSRGGRPDLAGEALAEVRAPALFIVGGNDREVLALNEEARRRMPHAAQFLVVPGATHLFEEPGTLEQVASAAAAFFRRHLAKRRDPEGGNPEGRDPEAAEPDPEYPTRYLDRTDAGVKLAEALGAYAGRSDLLVLGLPRGGVPVAAEVAKALDAPLDVFVVRKLGTPGQPELAMGAIASGGVRVLNTDVIGALGLSERVIDTVAAKEAEEVARRERAYRGDRPPLDVRGRTVILVDDGIATGSTVRAAARALRAGEPARLVVCAPVAAPTIVASLAAEADEVVCPLQTEHLYAIGLWYDAFPQVSDEEVRALLVRATAGGATPGPASHAASGARGKPSRQLSQ
jgi:putative phosphoribosyl transferase